ncbi:MAG: class I SAM-dependent methyltransferase, partial [Anaerolineae bacterium]|nr:class I SAM-dependent methyltransferase [Anaerolineae bacterium]
MKSTVEQIRQRFDNDVERFSNLQTGQSATIDAPLVLELITQVAATLHPQATASLDVGCGAGNYTLKLLQRLPNLAVTMIDLSQPMLDRARQRVSEVSSGTIETIQGDIRDIEIGEDRFEVIVAAAVLHHLRSELEWHTVFAKLYAALKPGGSLWISDLVEHSTEAVQALMWQR